MSGKIHTLARELFNKDSVEECSLEEVQDLAKRYPYFVPAQFLLLEKLKSSGSSEYETQLQKAVLYYHDPLEFEYFISSDRFYTEFNFEEIVVEEPVAVEAGEGSEMPSPFEAAPVIPEISTTFESNIDIPAFEPYHTVDY